MKILAQTNDMATGDVVVLTDKSRHAIRVPYAYAGVYSDRRSRQSVIIGFVMLALEHIAHHRLFPDGRHDRFKGFRA